MPVSASRYRQYRKSFPRDGVKVMIDITRSTVYYKAAGESEEELRLMRRIDELYIERPTRGSRSMRDCLDTEGYAVNRKRVQRLMRKMGLEAVYPKKKTSKPGIGHRIYAYLLRRLKIERPRQVYAADITYSARWRRAFSTSSPSSTGTAARCSRTGCRTRSTRPSA